MHKSFVLQPTSYLIFLSALAYALQISASVPLKPSFASNLVLMGDAKFTNGSSCIQVTDPGISSPSYGLVVQRNPTKFYTPASKRRRPLSFSTDFTFSISPDGGDGLDFLLMPKSCLSKLPRGKLGIPKDGIFFGVDFNTSFSDDLGENHVGVNVGRLVYVKTSNVSPFNNEIKLHSWIDYDSSSKRLEIRLSRFGARRAYIPLLVHHIDLGEISKNEDVYVGLSSSTGQSKQVTRVYSWKFRTRIVPTWLHSKPLDPRAFSRGKNDQKVAEEKRTCILGFLSGLFFLIGSGLLLVLLVMILWTMFENNYSETILMVPEKCAVHPGGGDFKYEKINVVVGDDNDELGDKN